MRHVYVFSSEDKGKAVSFIVLNEALYLSSGLLRNCKKKVFGIA